MSLAQSGRPTGQNAPSAPATVLIALFLLVGGGALFLRLGGGGALSPSEIDLSLPDWRPSPAELSALDSVDRARLAVDPGDSPLVLELMKAYESFNEADLRYGSNPRATALSDAKAEYEQRALTAVGFVGNEAYMGLGARVARQYLTALERGDTPTLNRLGGTFLTQARLTGLVGGERALRPGAERMIPIVFMARWAYAVSARARPGTLLSHEEATVLLRWKLTANPLVAPGRRQQIADQLLAQGTDFPVQRVLASRWADEGDWSAAARLYGEIARSHPQDRSAQATARYAQARAEAHRGHAP